MRGPERILVPLLAALIALGTAACGGGEETSGSTGGDAGTATAGPEDEADDEPLRSPKVPKDWKPVTNGEAGFTFAIPPGWSERTTPGGQGSVVTSPDELIVLTITADRTRGALELPVEEFATQTAEALGSDVVGRDRFRDLVVSDPVPFDDAYEASAVRASGRSMRSGVEELIFVVVLRDPAEASFVAVSRENAEQPSEIASRDDIKAIIRTLRAEPQS